jgi:hypothetical protein
MSHIPEACPTCSHHFPAPPEADELVYGDEHRRMLQFEEKWWQQRGAKEQAITTTFGLSITRYYQLLNAVLALPAALVEFPVLVHRLREIQYAARRRRFSW